jgi:hypothetical protein
VKYLRNDLALLHHLVERGMVRHHAIQVQRIVIDGLPVLKCGEVVLTTELLCRRLLHTVIADPHGRNHVLGLLVRLLLGDHRYLLRWYHTAQCVNRHHLLLLIGAIVLDDAPESSHLQLHLHQGCPIGVIGLGEARVATPTINLMNYPLDYNSVFGGVVIARSLASCHFHNKD